MFNSISTRKLLVAALVIPLAALVVLASVMLAYSPPAVVVEANVWPQSVDLAESLHREAILSAQVGAADGNASREELELQRIQTDELMSRWGRNGIETGQLQVQLGAVRIADAERDLSEAEELLVLAGSVRSTAESISPGVPGVGDLLVAARADAAIGVHGSSIATLTTAAKAQRTRIAGMVSVSNSISEAALPAGSESLRAVLDDTASLHTSLIDGDSVTIGQWTAGHIERQRAIGEVARATALRGGPVVPQGEGLPGLLLTGVAGTGLLGLLLFGFAVASRLNNGADDLAIQMRVFAKRTLPDALSIGGTSDSSGDEVPPLSEQIETVSVSGDLHAIGEAFNEVQQSAAYVLDRERSDHLFITNRVFESIADRNRTAVAEQLALLDELAAGEDDLSKLEQLAQLDTRMRRMQRDVVSLGALGGEHAPMLHEDRALSQLVNLAVEETHGVDRVRLVPVDNVLIDGGCAADVAHIITELLENALQSSPPESIVEVMCNNTDRGSLVVSIADEGHGMEPDEMEGLNLVLSGQSELKPETARTLGVVAISVIAARSGVDIRFTDSPTAGVTALITVPAAMVAKTPANWEPSTRLASQSRVRERKALAAEIAEEQSALAVVDEAPVGVVENDAVVAAPEKLGPAAFDRNLPVAEFEYDLDADQGPDSDVEEVRDLGEDPAPVLPVLESADKATTKDAPDSPSGRVDFDENPFESDFDENPFESDFDAVPKRPSDAEVSAGLNKRKKSPKKASKKRKPKLDKSDAQTPVATPRPVLASDEIEPGPTFDTDEVEARPTYAALDNLLANLPEKSDVPNVDTEVVVTSGLKRRVPRSASSAPPKMPPSGLDVAADTSSPSRPKTPEEVRDMLTKYRSGRE